MNSTKEWVKSQVWIQLNNEIYLLVKPSVLTKISDKLSDLIKNGGIDPVIESMWDQIDD